MNEPKVIYEDKHFLVINKPAGLQVHPAKLAAGRSAVRDAAPTLVDWLLARYPEIRNVGDEPSTRPGIVHRLDKETSGVMLIARDQKGFEYLKELFKKREIGKTYLAMVKGVPKKEEGTIDAPIGLRNGTTKRTIRGGRMAKEAVTEYKVVKALPDSRALLEVHPKTGRTHQIRVHLASIGHPIVGDTMYGGKARTAGAEAGRMMLHALSIEFTAPDGKRMRFEAESPF